MAIVISCGRITRAADVLQNGLIRAEFDGRGLTRVSDSGTQENLRIDGDRFSITIDGQPIDSDAATPSVQQPTEHIRAYVFTIGGHGIRVEYELEPGWRFVTKRLVIATPGKPLRVNRIEMLRTALPEPVSQGPVVRSAAFLRRAGGGAFIALQNPFLQFKQSGQAISAAYQPEMEWKAAYGPFESDRLCIGLYKTTGSRYPLHMVPEWKFVPHEPQAGEFVNWAEIEAITNCERAFLLDKRDHSVRVHVGWCENDYQIDAGTEQGRLEYKRIIDRAAAVGCRDILYAPANNLLSSLKENTDAWGWEEVLWLGLGQKIRKGQWDAHKDSIPASVAEILDYAKSKDVRLLAYVYPSLPFRQDPAWTAWAKGKSGGYRGADTGQRTFQDWLLDQLVTFHDKTGVGGYSFDHWFINYDGATSKYAQWYGCRRVLQGLRERIPGVVIDGRQQYQQFGAWTWLAGSYPHPTSTDEQPQSFRAFPDLHLDRVSSDRQRYAAWWYRVENFCPPEVLPGFITHQTPRDDAAGVMRRDRFRARDWDYLGWKYSLISSIATAPMNHVVNMIPARDLEEYQAFSQADQQYLREWLDWTDKNLDILRNIRPILSQPMIGRVDGTAAFKGNRGFLFLFNPNYRSMPAEFSLDPSIGLSAKGRFVLRQLFPDWQKGRVLGVWEQGEKVTIPMHGTEAMVLELSPAPAQGGQPLLIGSAGAAALRDGKLELAGVTGEAGTLQTLHVFISDPVNSVTINGKEVPFKRAGDLVSVGVRFAGQSFPQARQIGEYNPDFKGGAYRAEFAIPRRVFEQLSRRKRQWPVSYTDDDLRATWLGPARLLLFVNVADPTDKMQAELQIDGQPVTLTKAYSSIYPSAVERTFVGWYFDASSLAPDVRHSVEVRLPELAPGQFQGLFFDNVEPQFTDQITSGRG